jgi:hypothetical protein
MKPYIKKIGVVVAGYCASVLIAVAAVALRIKFLSGPDEEASSGMHAFGDALLFVTVFSVCALVPSGAALFFLVGFHGAGGRCGGDGSCGCRNLSRR